LGVHSGLALDIPNSAGYNRSIEGIVSYSYEQQPMLTLAYRPVSTNLLRLAIASTLTGTLPLRILLGCRSIQLAVRGQKADSCVLNLVRFSLMCTIWSSGDVMNSAGYSEGSCRHRPTGHWICYIVEKCKERKMVVSCCVVNL
jgi:hypothetical protein